MSETKHTPLPWRLGSPNVCCVKKHESHYLGPPDCEYTFQGWNDDAEYFGRFVSSKETQAEIIGSDEDGPMLSLSDAQLIVTSVNAHAQLEADSKKLREPATCNAGHKSNLPIALWDCPVCTQLLRDQLQQVKDKANAVISEFVEMSEGRIEFTPKSIQELSAAIHEVEAALKI